MATKATTKPDLTPTIAELGEEWDLSLAAQNKSPDTRKTYLTAVRQFDEFAIAKKLPRTIGTVRREHVEAFIAHLLATRSPSTAKTRFGGLQAFFNWAVENDEIPATPMAKMKPPFVPHQKVAIVRDPNIKALLRTCDGKSFYDRRDLAMIRLLLSTGMRRAELTKLKVTDIDFEDPTVYITRGKGGRPRSCRLGPKTALVLKRYLRVRATHHAADSDRLWLGKLGVLGDAGVAQALERRGAAVGIHNLHAHQFRHTFAHKWMAADGAEGDLMRVAGWSDRRQLDKYGASAADERAHDAHRRLNPGEDF